MHFYAYLLHTQRDTGSGHARNAHEQAEVTHWRLPLHTLIPLHNGFVMLELDSIAEKHLPKWKHFSTIQVIGRYSHSRQTAMTQSVSEYYDEQVFTLLAGSHRIVVQRDELFPHSLHAPISIDQMQKIENERDSPWNRPVFVERASIFVSRISFQTNFTPIDRIIRKCWTMNDDIHSRACKCNLCGDKQRVD